MSQKKKPAPKMDVHQTDVPKKKPPPKTTKAWSTAFLKIGLRAGMSPRAIAGTAARDPKAQLNRFKRGAGALSQARNLRDALRDIDHDLFIPPIELDTGERVVEGKYAEWVDLAVRLHHLPPRSRKLLIAKLKELAPIGDQALLLESDADDILRQIPVQEAHVQEAHVQEALPKTDSGRNGIAESMTPPRPHHR